MGDLCETQPTLMFSPCSSLLRGTGARVGIVLKESQQAATFILGLLRSETKQYRIRVWRLITAILAAASFKEEQVDDKPSSNSPLLFLQQLTYQDADSL